MKKITNLALFTFLIVFQFEVLAVDTLATCKLVFDESEETLSSYTVLRDGDRMYGRYRLTEGRDYQETDDIFLKKYEGEDLVKLRENGKLESLAKALNIEINKIEKVHFFGMVEINDDDDEQEDDDQNSSFTSLEEDPPAPIPSPPVYLMEIFRIYGNLNTSLGSVGKPFEKDYSKCNNSRFYHRFL